MFKIHQIRLYHKYYNRYHLNINNYYQRTKYYFHGSNNSTQTLYATLGVVESATDDEIKKAYRALAKKWHPDINQTDNASVRFTQINAAYTVLSDKSKKKQYDEQIGNFIRTHQRMYDSKYNSYSSSNDSNNYESQYWWNSNEFYNDSKYEYWDFEDIDDEYFEFNNYKDKGRRFKNIKNHQQNKRKSTPKKDKHFYAVCSYYV